MTYGIDAKLDCLIRLAFIDDASEDAAEFDSIDDSDVVLSDGLLTRVRRLVAAKKRKNGVKKIKKVMSRVGMVALIAMAALLVLLFSVSATREAIFNAVMEWYDDYFTVQFNPSDAEASESSNGVADTEAPPESTEKPALIPPATIEEIRKPTYLPNGVEEEIVAQSQSACVYEYYIGDEWVGSFQQFILTDTKKYFDSEGAITENVFINDYTGLLITYEKKENILLVWSDNEYIYILETEMLEVEDIIKICESVQ